MTVGPPDATNITTVTQWAQVLLGQMGNPTNTSNMSFLVSWANLEGGNFNNTALYNPLNTTEPEPGSTVMSGGNSAGVQAYVSWQQGLNATITVLNNGDYPNIVTALRAGNATAANNNGTLAPDLLTWSGRSYSSVPISSVAGTGAPVTLGNSGTTSGPPMLGDSPITTIGTGGAVYRNYKTPVGFDPSLDKSQLLINGLKCDANITNAISSLQLERTITGASTLTITFEDPEMRVVNSRIALISAPQEPTTLVSSGAPVAGTTGTYTTKNVQTLTPIQRHELDGGSAAASGDDSTTISKYNSGAAYYPTTCSLTDGTSVLTFALVSLQKSGNTVTMTFEDIIVNQLRYAYNPSGAGLNPAAGQTRADFMNLVITTALSRINGMVTIPALVYPPNGTPGINPIVSSSSDTGTVWGSVENPDEDAWSCLTQTANTAQWRCFSTGTCLVFGPDSWLLNGPVAAKFRQFTDGVDFIDFTCDIGQAEATCTVNLNTGSQLSFAPGSVVIPLDLGWASIGGKSGKMNSALWLVSDMTRELHQPDCQITLAQPQPGLTEAQIASTEGATSTSTGSNSSGQSNVGASGGPGAATGQGESVAADGAVAYAVKQVGKPYKWGGTGPGSYDCSGLAYAAYGSVGISIPRDTYDQWTDIPTQVSLSSLLPGDLVYYMGSDPEGGLPGHVVLYIGNGNVVQAEETGTNIMTLAMPAGSIGARRPAPAYNGDGDPNQ